MSDAPVRNYGLDVLRSLAIAAVLLEHGAVQILGRAAPSAGVWTLAFAFWGVEWFFVLSGFLIGGILLRQIGRGGPVRLSAIRQFWIRRWFRTLPNYYLFVVVYLVLAAVSIHPYPMSVRQLLFLQNLTYLPVGPFAEAWSLSVEEIFYVALPLSIYLASLVSRRNGKVAFLAGTTLLLAVPTVLRIAATWGMAAMPDWNERVRVAALYRLDAVGYGVVAAMAFHWGKGWRSAPRLQAVLGLAMVLLGGAMAVALLKQAPLALEHPFLLGNLVFPVTSMGTALTLPWFHALRPSDPRVEALFTRVSLYSYSLYLCNLPIAFLLLHSLRLDELATLPAALLAALFWLALCSVVAAFLYHRFESRVTAVRERFSSRVAAV